jgi:dienelactone hydrolase
VILCHAWQGRDRFICDAAEKIASWGYVGFALDMYGKGILAKTREESAALKKPFMDNRSKLLERALAGVHAARSLPFIDAEQIALLGFGFGGVCALDLARTGENFKGTISVYGHFDRPANLPLRPIPGKIFLLHGYNDPIAKQHELRHFEQEMDELQADWQLHLFGNTLHAFMNPAINAPQLGTAYQPLSADRTWSQIRLFLSEIFPS